jgi:DNA repair exonuclease SbcCD ATPase subunit
MAGEDSSDDPRAKEIVMPVPMGQALQHIEITVLRQISESISTQTRHIETLTAMMYEVRERVAGIEGAELKKSVEKLEVCIQSLEDKLETRIQSLEDKLETRIQGLNAAKADATAFVELQHRVSDLEKAEERVRGAMGLWGWISRNAPWLATLILIGAQMLGYLHKP